MRRLFFVIGAFLPADAMEKVRYIVDPRMDDEHSLGNRKGGDRLKKKKCYIYLRIFSVACIPVACFLGVPEYRYGG